MQSMICGLYSVEAGRITKLDEGFGITNGPCWSPDGSKIYFTPQPLFFNLTTEWAASLQKMAAKEVAVDEGLDRLAASVDRQLKQAGLG